jgi:hypothetical protein
MDFGKSALNPSYGKNLILFSGEGYFPGVDLSLIQSTLAKVGKIFDFIYFLKDNI